MQRDHTIDIAKGVAIIAIVLGHVDRGLVAADVLDGSDRTVQQVDLILYLFHLTVFATLSGVFVSRSARRDGVATYTRSRVGTFLYLYVLWSFAQGVVRLAAGDSANTETGPRDLVTQLWEPDNQLWLSLIHI